MHLARMDFLTVGGAIIGYTAMMGFLQILPMRPMSLEMDGNGEIHGHALT